MAQYKIYFNTNASTGIEVEADSYDEAVDKAYEEGMPSICAQCSGWGQRAGIEVGDEWDPDERSYYLDGVYTEIPQEKPAPAEMPV